MRVRVAHGKSLLGKTKQRRPVRELLHPQGEDAEIFWRGTGDRVRQRSITGESERGRDETTKERRGETERTRTIGTRQSRRRDVYVYAELRYFAEDGVGVDCGVEERRY